MHLIAMFIVYYAAGTEALSPTLGQGVHQQKKHPQL